MRWLLAPAFGIVVAGGLLTLHLSGVAKAEEVQPAPRNPDPFPIPVQHEMVPAPYESLMYRLRVLALEHERRQARQLLEEDNAQVEEERQRAFRRGDFWTNGEIKQLFDPPAPFGR
jgi:hypothetical protein